MTRGQRLAFAGLALLAAAVFALAFGHLAVAILLGLLGSGLLLIAESTMERERQGQKME